MGVCTGMYSEWQSLEVCSIIARVNSPEVYATRVSKTDNPATPHVRTRQFGVWKHCATMSLVIEVAQLRMSHLAVQVGLARTLVAPMTNTVTLLSVYLVPGMSLQIVQYVVTHVRVLHHRAQARRYEAFSQEE
jgi:hypothetical protein